MEIFSKISKDKKFPILCIVGAVVLVILGIFLGKSLLFTTSGGSLTKAAHISPYLANRFYEGGVSYSKGSVGYYKSPAVQERYKPEVRIAEAEVKCYSKNVEKDYYLIESKVKELEGYIQDEYKNEYWDRIEMIIVVRVKRENFKTFVEFIKKNFDVSYISAKDYRMKLWRTIDEIYVLNQTYKDLEKIHKNLEKMINSGGYNKDLIDQLIYLTEKKKNLVREMRAYLRDYYSALYKSEMSTVKITLVQEKSITIRVKDFFKEFKKELNKFLNDLVDYALRLTIRLVDSVVGLVVLLIELFVKALVVVFIIKIFWEIVKKIFSIKI